MLAVFPPPSPLVDVGLGYITELEKELTLAQQSNVRDVLTRYVARLISYQDCVSALVPLIGTSKPIDRLEAILCTPQVPLPACPAWSIPPNLQDSRAKTHPWSAYEDQRLLAGLHRFGFDAWAVIAAFVGNGRTKAQCSQRWARGLDPKICKDHWPADQDERLIELVVLYGEKSWTRIASELGNRCDVQCRYRYKQLQKEPGFEQRRAAAVERAQKITAPPKPSRTLKAKVADRLVPQFPIVGAPRPLEMPFWNHPQTIPRMETQGALPSPGPVIPPGNIDPTKLASTGQFPLIDCPQISAQGSAFDWANSFGLSPSGSVMGISPMNSFKFES
jgi:hypothetical protein